MLLLLLLLALLVLPRGLRLRTRSIVWHRRLHARHRVIRGALHEVICLRGLVVLWMRLLLLVLLLLLRRVGGHRLGDHTATAMSCIVHTVRGASRTHYRILSNRRR